MRQTVDGQQRRRRSRQKSDLLIGDPVLQPLQARVLRLRKLIEPIRQMLRIELEEEPLAKDLVGGKPVRIAIQAGRNTKSSEAPVSSGARSKID